MPLYGFCQYGCLPRLGAAEFAELFSLAQTAPGPNVIVVTAVVALFCHEHPLWLIAGGGMAGWLVQYA